MNEPDKRNSRSRIPIAILATLLLYVLSFGPACWIASKYPWRGSAFINAVYAPVMWVWSRSPQSVRERIDVYANFGQGPGHVFISEYGVSFWSIPVFLCPTSQ